jgi:hypothetical protein
LYADPDPDPTAQINADPCGSGSGYGSGSETLTKKCVTTKLVLLFIHPTAVNAILTSKNRI